MKKTHQLQDPTNSKIILEELRIADTFLERFKGLMGKTLNDSEGLWIEPCNSIHCFFMKIPIDVLFLDQDNKIIHKISHMKPCSVSPIIKGAHSVIEGPAGSFETLLIGNQVEVISR